MCPVSSPQVGGTEISLDLWVDQISFSETHLSKIKRETVSCPALFSGLPPNTAQLYSIQLPCPELPSIT